MEVLFFSLYFFLLISWLFPFLRESFFFSLFPFHFISFFPFSFLSLFVLFNLGGSFVLVRVKQAMGFYRIFIIKKRGGGVCTVGNAITKKKMKNKYKRTTRVYSITR